MRNLETKTHSFQKFPGSEMLSVSKIEGEIKYLEDLIRDINKLRKGGWKTRFYVLFL